MSAVYAQGTAPFSRIHATATEVSRPPEKAMPTRSPTGREVSTLDMPAIICTPLHDHATRSGHELDSVLPGSPHHPLRPHLHHIASKSGTLYPIGEVESSIH